MTIFFLEKNLELVKLANEYSESETGFKLVAKSYFNNEQLTSKLIRPELFDVFNDAIEKPEKSRTQKQRQIVI